jgi:hypothetical protein
MLRFPALASGAVAQYPAACVRDCRTRILQYTDGSEQRYAEVGGPLLRWHIRLDRLTEEEADNLMRFLAEARGRAGAFSFTDPWTGIEHENCTLEHDRAVVEFEDNARARAAITIRRLT